MWGHFAYGVYWIYQKRLHLHKINSFGGGAKVTSSSALLFIIESVSVSHPLIACLIDAIIIPVHKQIFAKCSHTRSASVYSLFIAVCWSVGGVIVHNDRARTFRYRTCVFIAYFLSRTWLTLNSVSLFIMQMRETFILLDKGIYSNFRLVCFELVRWWNAVTELTEKIFVFKKSFI